MDRKGLVSSIDIGLICWIVGYLSYFYHLNVTGPENLKLLRGTVGQLSHLHGAPWVF